MRTEIRSIEHRRQLGPFLRLPATVYRDDPSWVAPIRVVEGARLLGTGFDDPTHRFKLLVAERDGVTVGRIAVFRDASHDRHKDEDVCFFGYFEALDQEGGRALLDAAATQGALWGATRLRGPRGPTRLDKRGVLVEGHHLPPFLAGHHPDWYRDLLESGGFTKHHDALAYEIDLLEEDGSPRSIPPRLARKAASVDIPGLEVRPFRWSQALEDVDMAHRVMVEAFRDVPDNTPLPRATFRALALPFLAVTHREMLQLAVVDGEPAGFALCVPELNEALIHAQGRAGPAGVTAVLRGRRSIRTASFKLLGLLPAYRRTGLHALLIREACLGAQRAGYSRLEASLIDDRNRPMRAVVQGAGMEIYRRNRVYERAL